VSAIFISYTGRDPEGDAWADRLAEWFKDWNYGYFRDKDHSHGVKAGDDWRQTLYAELADARAVVCLCSKEYDSSPWCVGEVAIAVEKGKTVIPIQLATTAEELKTEPLPLLLQTKQAIKVTDAANPSPKLLGEVQQQLQATLQKTLNWRDLLHWDRALAPYPGLPAFKEHQAPVFFGRDKTIEEVVERLAALALRPPGFLLLLGASGYGKSSLVRAGVVPRLKKDPEQEWLVLPPFTPGDEPFAELAEAVSAVGGEYNAADPLGSIRKLQREGKRTLVLVIDQFEELLTAGPKDEGQDDQGEAFQEFLLQLLRSRKTRLLVVATMRTDFLAPLQARWPALTGMVSTSTLKPIEPEDFGELIMGPADRSSLTLEPGLTARLVKDSGGRDALPLLAFTLEKLWKARDGQVLTVKAYEDLDGVAGAVSTRAEECWNPQTSSEEVRQALREAFLDHLVSVSGDGREAKRPAPLADLPIASREIVQRMVDDRLLVQKDGIVEIAHEALLRTWEPLKQWIEEGSEKLEQQRRVRRFCTELALSHPLHARLSALQGLVPLVKADPAAGAPVSEIVASILTESNRGQRELLLAIQLLGLIGGEVSVSALSKFLQQQQLSEPVKTRHAASALETLCQAAEALQDIHRRTPLPADNDERWLLLPSATLSGPEWAVRTQLVRLRLWATPRLEESGAWFEPLGEGVALTMVTIPSGSFLMGSPADELERSYDEGLQNLNIQDSFWISQAPITQAQWRLVMGSNPSQFQGSYDDEDRRPVEMVTWDDAMNFCIGLGKVTSRYYSLPTEAQWEYACRAGTTTPFHCGDSIITHLANFNGLMASYSNAEFGVYCAQTTPVGRYPANSWGLHDLHGNVWEWCNGPRDAEAGLPLRGGGWLDRPEFCRAACRNFNRSDKCSLNRGFRVICLPH
jgi:formylglycine-generating enzyme required for sulfatase activity